MFCPKCGSRYIDDERKLCPKCMDKNKIIRRTGEFLLKYKAEVITIVAMLVLTSAFGILTPYISSGFYYDQVLDKAGKYYGEVLLCPRNHYRYAPAFAVYINVPQHCYHENSRKARV